MSPAVDDEFNEYTKIFPISLSTEGLAGISVGLAEHFQLQQPLGSQLISRIMQQREKTPGISPGPGMVMTLRASSGWHPQQAFRRCHKM